MTTYRLSATRPSPNTLGTSPWYWSGVIKNYTQAVAGKVPVDKIGVSVGADKYTFVVTTEGKCLRSLHPKRHALLAGAFLGGWPR